MNDDMTFIVNKSGYGKENWELQKRIDKAIKYLEDNTRYSVLSGMVEFYGSTEEVIDILKGSDKDEKD